MPSYQIVRKRRGSQYQYRLERKSSYCEPQLLQIFWTRDEAEEALGSLLQLEGAAAIESVATGNHAAGEGRCSAGKAKG